MGEVYRATDLALEPALRARWPHSIVTWNRLLAGRWLAVGVVAWTGAESVSRMRAEGA